MKDNFDISVEDFDKLEWAGRLLLGQAYLEDVLNKAEFVKLREGAEEGVEMCFNFYEGKVYKVYKYDRYSRKCMSIIDEDFVSSGSGECMGEHIYSIEDYNALYFEPVDNLDTSTIDSLKGLVEEAQRKLREAQQTLSEEGVVMFLDPKDEPDWNSSSLYC